MQTFIRRLRGAVGLAALWAAVWLPAGVLLSLATGWAGDALLLPLWYFGGWTALGGLSGGIFGLMLAVLERRRSFHELSARRITIWGAIAGAALPVGGSLLLVLLLPNAWLTPDAPVVFAAMALLGGGCAWATLALARRGAPIESVAPPT